MTSPDTGTPIRSLYAHVPFCAKKCDYCAFFSGKPTPEGAQRFVDALVLELALVAPHFQPGTVFFGGGTPSLLNRAQWSVILKAMERLDLLGASEWTVECNPATVSKDKARLLRDHGVNRISMGVQSLEPDLLDRLGRIHSREQVFRSFDILRQAGFENINLDLMFAIPGQTLAQWRATMAEAIALESEHLSCYEVIYEEDTALYAQLKAGEFDVDEELAAAMYTELIDTAGQHGFEQYEIANFAQGGSGDPGVIPARACRHNINYWRAGSYFGLGPSASGYEGGTRTRNLSNTEQYCADLEAGRRPVEYRETLPPLPRAGETAAFGLRMNAGWELDEFQRITGFRLETEWHHEIEELQYLGHARLRDNRFALTRTGLRYADWAAERFLRLAEPEATSA